jgi:DNA-binding CsgD family transcriptional regulator
MCPKCAIRPKLNRAYCARCDNQYRRARRAAGNPPKTVIVRDAYGFLPLHVKILQFMCQGLESVQIASRLGLNLGYVKHRRAEMLDITGCINSHHLTAWAALRGYADLQDRGSRRDESALFAHNLNEPVEHA